uniref:Uncharacterized protein n=1 Tax=uncultured Spirochaetaceae bacterium TaxID=201186 RepID=A0A650EQ46_9SPIO|nr:hypothetical protein Unknown280_0900 [uncultured Spirochaetaceae bacterium]
MVLLCLLTGDFGGHCLYAKRFVLFFFHLIFFISALIAHTGTEDYEWLYEDYLIFRGLEFIYVLLGFYKDNKDAAIKK